MKFWNWVRNVIIAMDDPVRHCKAYKDMGCAHVDGMHCDMRTCDILKGYKDMLEGTQEICPRCGTYCTGKTVFCTKGLKE